MPEKTTANDPGQEKSVSQEAPWWKSVLLRRWVVILIVGSLVVDGAVLAMVHKSSAKITVEPEYTLGTFSFLASDPANAGATSGTFNLHVRFIDDLNAQARQQIVMHQFRVQESIEDLLQKAHGIELDDPAVARLKHQIQERIDSSLDLRAVAEVIITDLNYNSRQITGATLPAAAASKPTENQSRQDANSAAKPTTAAPDDHELGSMLN